MAAAATLRAQITGRSPEHEAKAMFGDDRATEYMLKAASAPAMTSVSGWAQELAAVAIYDLIQSTASISAAADLISRALQVSLDGVAELHVPGRVLNAAAAGQWVAEGAAAPVRVLAFSTTILQPRKLVTHSTYSREPRTIPAFGDFWLS